MKSLNDDVRCGRVCRRLLFMQIKRYAECSGRIIYTSEKGENMPEKRNVIINGYAYPNIK